VLAALSVHATACVTTLGYVPEYVKVRGEGKDALPSYAAVREWATDVGDGYDSRASMNRSALYAGAVVAAAAVSALAGIAAYHPHSSALVAIPISTGFLGAVAAVYQNDEKAKLYRYGSNSIKDALRASDRRLPRRIADEENPTQALERATRQLSESTDELAKAEARAASQKQAAGKARSAADSAAAGKDKEALINVADAADVLVVKANDAAREQKARVSAAEVRAREAKERLALGAKAEGDAEQAAEAAEALCLREDVDAVMRQVDAWGTLLDPSKMPELLQAVRAGSPRGRRCLHADLRQGRLASGIDCDAFDRAAATRVRAADRRLQERMRPCRLS
jgi:hypothetical protein